MYICYYILLYTSKHGYQAVDLNRIVIYDKPYIISTLKVLLEFNTTLWDERLVFNQLDLHDCNSKFLSVYFNQMFQHPLQISLLLN